MKISERISHVHLCHPPSPELEGLCSRLFAFGPLPLVGEQPDVQINRGAHCGRLLDVSGDSNTSIREALM